MAEHVRFTVDTAVAVYFCDPHSPWQRGSNENTNRLLRQYLPKGGDFRELVQDQLNDIAAELTPGLGRPWHGGRPAQCSWRPPSLDYDEVEDAVLAPSVTCQVDDGAANRVADRAEAVQRQTSRSDRARASAHTRTTVGVSGAAPLEVVQAQAHR